MTDHALPGKPDPFAAVSRHRWLLPMLFGLLAIVVYWPCMDGPPHFDDKHVLALVNGDSPWVVLQQPRRIVTHLTFALNAALHGEMMLGYHLVNVLIHAVAAWGLVVLVRQLAGPERPARAAVIAGILFLLHPLATQAVCYVSQRYTALAGAFFIWSLVAYLRSRGSSHERHWLAVAGVLGLLALFSKEYVIGIPVAALALEWLWPISSESQTRRWRRAAVYLLPLLLFVAAYWRDVVPVEPVDPPLITTVAAKSDRPLDWASGKVPRTTYALTQITIVPTVYLRTLIWPSGQSVDHDFTPAERVNLRVVVWALALLALLALAWWRRRREPLIAFGIFLVGITLFPTSSLMPNSEFVAEHRAYLALAGAAMAAGSLLARIPSPAVYVVVAILALVGSTLTMRRAVVWSDQVLLWQDAIAKTEWVPRPHYALGSIYQERGDYEAAETAYRQSLERAPAYGPALFNLSLVYEVQGRYREAFDLNAKRLMQNPNQPDALDNAIRLAFKLKDLKRAEFAVKQARTLYPEHLPFRVAAARLAYLQGNLDTAEAQCRQLLAENLSALDRAAIDYLLKQIEKASREVAP